MELKIKATFWKYILFLRIISKSARSFSIKFTALQLSNGELSDDAHFVQKLITLKVNQLTNYSINNNWLT